MEGTCLVTKKPEDSGLPGPFCCRWQENNPRSVPKAGFVLRDPNTTSNIFR